MRLCTFPSALQLLTVFDETCLVSGDSEIGDRLLTEIVGASKSKQKLFFFLGTQVLQWKHRDNIVQGDWCGLNCENE